MTGVNSLAPPANWNLEVIDASGRVDVSKISGTAQTARDRLTLEDYLEFENLQETEHGYIDGF